MHELISMEGTSMTQKIRDIMTEAPVTLDVDATAVQAAEAMQEHDIGEVLITTNGMLHGVLTDRDLVIRVLAEGLDPHTIHVGEVCSRDLATLELDDDTTQAIDLIRAHAIRRIPILDGTTPVGVVTIGDLAIERDDRSALADVSAAAPNS